MSVPLQLDNFLDLFTEIYNRYIQDHLFNKLTIISIVAYMIHDASLSILVSLHLLLTLAKGHLTNVATMSWQIREAIYCLIHVIRGGIPTRNL